MHHHCWHTTREYGLHFAGCCKPLRNGKPCQAVLFHPVGIEERSHGYLLPVDKSIYDAITLLYQAVMTGGAKEPGA